MSFLAKVQSLKSLLETFCIETYEQRKNSNDLPPSMPEGAGSSSSHPTTHTTVIVKEARSGLSVADLFFIFHSSPRPTVINNFSSSSTSNHQKKDESKQEAKSDALQKIFAACAAVIIAGVGVFWTSKDEYLAFKKQDFHQEKQILKTNIDLKDEVKLEFYYFEVAFDNWHKSFTARTQPKLVGKVGVTGSALGIAASLGFASVTGGISFILLGGALGCYWLWNHLNAELTKEKRLLQLAIEKLNEVEKKLLPQQPSFSVPLMDPYDQSSIFPPSQVQSFMETNYIYPTSFAPQKNTTQDY